jgi:hypothetical protein
MPEFSRNLKYDHVFAIVRVDRFHDPVATPETAIMVKKIVRSEQLAEDEVARLNALNRDKGSLYFWQITRLERSGELTEAEVTATEGSKGVATTASSS